MVRDGEIWREMVRDGERWGQSTRERWHSKGSIKTETNNKDRITWIVILIS